MYHITKKLTPRVFFLIFFPAGVARGRFRENRVPPFEGGQGSSDLWTLGIQVPSTFQMKKTIRVEKTKERHRQLDASCHEGQRRKYIASFLWHFIEFSYNAGSAREGD